jgi:hypothetical protein
MELPLYAQKQLEKASAGIAKMDVEGGPGPGPGPDFDVGGGGPMEGLGKTMSGFMPVNYRELSECSLMFLSFFLNRY